MSDTFDIPIKDYLALERAGICIPGPTAHQVLDYFVDVSGFTTGLEIEAMGPDGFVESFIESEVWENTETGKAFIPPPIKGMLEKWYASEVGGKVLAGKSTSETASRMGAEKPEKRATEKSKAKDAVSDPIEQEYLKANMMPNLHPPVAATYSVGREHAALFAFSGRGAHTARQHKVNVAGQHDREVQSFMGPPQ